MVQVEDILVDSQGVTFWGAGLGPLADSTAWAELNPPHTEIIRHVPGPSGTLRDGKGVVNDKFTFDLQPFIGTLGTAAEWEIESTVAGQGQWGGNLDVRDFKPGSKIRLPVFHSGALLFLGDVHAAQGDTEFYATADEARAEVTLSCEVIKGRRINTPRVEKPESIVSVVSAKPLEEAVKLAVFDLMEWMVTEYGVSKREAYLHTTINPDFRINVYQMAPIGKLRYTVGAEIPKKYL